MLERLKRLWKLSDVDPDVLAVMEQAVDEKLTFSPTDVKGDGKAVFMADMTEAEYQAYMREQNGWGKFFRKVKNLGKE